jgi:large subunit ribosomal protein L19
MSRSAVIDKLQSQQMKKNIPSFRVGDTVRVHIRIIEGDKERLQVFTGTVIARKGSGLSETFSVHRVAYGEGMERVFMLHSPRIAKIEIAKEGDVRRSKLYYLRGTSGKKSKVKGRFGPRRASKTDTKESAAVSEGPTENIEAAID